MSKTLLLLVLILAEGAFARLSVNLAPLLETTAGRQIFGRLTGKSFQEIGSVSARESVLWESIKHDRELTSRISQASNKIAQSHTPEAIARSLLNGIKGQRTTLSEGTGIVVNPKRGLIGRIRGENMTARLQSAFKARSDVSDPVARQIIKAGQNFRKGTGVALYGPDAVKCANSFENSLIEGLSGIVAEVANSAKIASVKDGFNGLVRGAAKTDFKLAVTARERVCKLAGQRAACRIFSPAIAGHCL